MRVFWVLLSQLLPASVAIILHAGQVSAATSIQPVELTVPATTIEVSGYSPPGSLVTFELDGVVVGTATASASGVFSKVLTSVNPGLATVSVFYEQEDKKSVSQTKNISVQPQQQNSVEFLLAPILYTNGPVNPVTPRNIVLEGFAPPDSTVLLQSTNGLILQTIVDANGRYSFTINGSQFGVGEVSFKSQVQFMSNTSPFSESLNISFQPPASENGADEPDIIVNPNQPATPVVTSPTEETSSVDGDTVTIRGQAQPGTQIVVYVNGQVAGSVFVNANGEWTFTYQSIEERALFQFSACDGVSCSLPSKPLELQFGLVAGECEIDISLKQFRFWGISLGERITLSGNALPFDAKIEIDWGDGTREVFSYVSNTSFGYAYQYDQSGVYNGSILVTLDEECSKRVYFSAVVDQYEREPVNFLPLALAVFSILPVSLLANQLGKKFI